jgi:hypothetical protein
MTMLDRETRESTLRSTSKGAHFALEHELVEEMIKFLS